MGQKSQFRCPQDTGQAAQRSHPTPRMGLELQQVLQLHPGWLSMPGGGQVLTRDRKNIL